MIAFTTRYVPIVAGLPHGFGLHRAIRVLYMRLIQEDSTVA
jgi:hypothetical protein